jgi:hypothetical protein
MHSEKNAGCVFSQRLGMHTGRRRVLPLGFLAVSGHFSGFSYGQARYKVRKLGHVPFNYQSVMPSQPQTRIGADASSLLESQTATLCSAA